MLFFYYDRTKLNEARNSIPLFAHVLIRNRRVVAKAVPREDKLRLRLVARRLVSLRTLETSSSSIRSVLGQVRIVDESGKKKSPFGARYSARLRLTGQLFQPLPIKRDAHIFSLPLVHTHFAEGVAFVWLEGAGSIFWRGRFLKLKKRGRRVGRRGRLIKNRSSRLKMLETIGSLDRF